MPQETESERRLKEAARKALEERKDEGHGMFRYADPEIVATELIEEAPEVARAWAAAEDMEPLMDAVKAWQDEKAKEGGTR